MPVKNPSGKAGKRGERPLRETGRACRNNPLDPPPSFVGRSLREMALRKRCEVSIIIREQSPERFVMVPGADFVVKEWDVLVILGRETDLTEIKELR